MKKTAASILLILYVAFSCGVIVNLHYCMDRFDSMQLGANESQYCGKCGMHSTDSNGCCHDQVQIFKISDDHQVSVNSFKFSSPDVIAIKIPSWDVNLVATDQNSFYRDTHSPPLSKQDSYLQNCVFRI